MQVFISYKREDVDFAKRLYGLIEACDFTPWLDVMNLRPGDDWDSAIHQGMKDAQIVIGVLTTESLGSNNVLDEWGYALSTGKRLFLLWLREVDEADIPPRYIRIQRIDMRHNEAAGLEKLRTALQSAAKIVPESLLTGETQGAGDPLQRRALGTPAFPSFVPRRHEAEPTFSETDVPTPQTQQKTNRSRMLEKIKLFWVRGVLEQSIYGAALLELGFQPHAKAVDNPWDTVLQHLQYGDYRLPTGTKINDIYHDLNGELLILGNPGSGKTTTLLELARDRIMLAENDDSEPIPVVLNLSSWADERKPLTQWLVNELNTKYAVPRKVAATWVISDALLLLLDGLDEVLLRYRDQCVQAINDFRNEHGFTRIVVCSRSADYEALSTRLHLTGAVVLQALNQEQIGDYLYSLGSEMQGVREAMTFDPDLRKLAESPLMLGIMTLAFRGLPIEDLPPLQSIEAQRRRLFETYTHRMFERRPPQHDTSEHIMHYLKWLAGRMVERKQSVFYIENLQIDWIAGDLPRRLYRVVGRSLFGAIAGAAIGALSGFAMVFLFALIGNTSLQTLSVSNLIGAIFACIALPAGMGALVFALSGLQAYALDSIPDEFRPFKQMFQRIVGVIAAGATLGLITLVLSGFGLFILALLLNVLNPEYMSYDRSSEAGGVLTGWLALALEAASYSGFSLGVGVLAGTIATAVAIAVKFIKSRRRVLIGMVTFGFIGVLIGLLILECAMVVFTLLYHRINAKVGPDIVLGFAIMGGLLAFSAYALPRRLTSIPFTLFSLVSAGAVLVYVAVYDLMFRDGPVVELSNVIVITVLLLTTAAFGYFVGRVNDHIESAETLRWRWSWRWSLVGLAGVVLLGLALGYRVIYDYSRWTASAEAAYVQTQLNPMQSRIDTANAVTAQADAQWAQYTATVSDFAHIGNLVDQQVRLESQYLYSTDFYTFDEKSRSIGCVVVTYPDFIRFTLSPSQLAQIQEQLNKVSIQLATYSSAQVNAWKNTRYAQLYCPPQADEIRRELLNDQRHNTINGIRDAAISVIEPTIILGLAFIFGGGVIGGLRKTESIEIRTRPNSGIYRTLQSAIRVMVAFGLVGLVIGGLVGALLTTLPEGDFSLGSGVQSELMPFGMVIGLAIGVALGLLMGGSDAVVKHMVLRFFLRRSDSIPRNYAALLDDAADRILLRKVGGGYIFIHRYLLEYYASLEDQPDSPPSTS